MNVLCKGDDEQSRKMDTIWANEKVGFYKWSLI